MKKFDGKISISRFTSNHAPYSGIHLEIIDSISHLHLLDVEISSEEFGNAVTGLGYRPCKCELNPNTDLIGKREEHKTVQIDISDLGAISLFDKRGEKFQNLVTKLAEPYSFDGWLPFVVETCVNHHHMSHKDGKVFYAVHFHRFVDNNGEAK